MLILRRCGSVDAVLAVLTATTTVHIGLIVLGNITDYDTNHQFVLHVLAMDTTFRSPATMWRAVTSPALVTATYLAIIGWELVSTILLATATVMWLRRAGNHSHATARQLSSTGWLMWLILFGGGFIAIGGEWFAMWQSTHWNGLNPALQNFVIASVCLVLTHLPPQSSPPRAGSST
ncbi:DUF2165 domain-containing protein [Pseudonocardia spinosispora]|uniref:DUF2165 domain-containing protein n=1 Tax=Pseudonocardia spinosispora TaxID=103441 RepID=UPI0004247D23|nr:DUF2165 domain-containing protein [Pseudonocardia spinosispora]